MRSCWLSRSGQPCCLLFFAGWGMDPEPFRPIVPQGHDLLMFYDYRELGRPEPAEFFPGQYQRVDLLAWSMGVWVAGHLLGGYRRHLRAAVAVNGTLTPIDDRGGIPEQAFAEMLTTFSPAALTEFYRSMFDDRAGAARFLNQRPERPDEEIGEELAALRNHWSALGPAPDIYTAVLAGARDRIFAGRNQVRAWGRERCRLFSGPHFPFYDLDWDALLRAEA
ncbi:MAG: DUF452 family protein [Desulfobulbus sp.]|nr:MAG: DUF452 family protein [Desulfobulbus sp.]